MPSPPSPFRYVVLLRAVNLGPVNKLPMAELRRVCIEAGGGDVQTYIQSGNVVLSSTLDEPSLKATLEAAIAAESGLATDVIIRTAAEMARVVDLLPYPDADPTHLHVGFAAAPPSAEAQAAIAAIDLAPEEVTVVGRDIYLYLPNGTGRSKVPGQMGRRLGQPVTVRNWRTVTTLRAMALEPPA